MMRLFRATALSIVLAAACSEHPAPIVDPDLEPAANHVPGEPPTVHSVGVQVNGAIATIVWHVDPFNVGEGYTVEVYAGASCAGTNLVPGGANVPGIPWTQPLHLYVDAGPLAAGDHCARVKSNGVFSPPSFRTFITVNFVVGTANSPPEAGFTGPDGALEGESVTFVGVAEDPDGDALTVEWAVDGQLLSTGSSFTHAFADDGTYVVTLTVADGRGGTAAVTRSVEVTNVAPAMPAAKNAAAGNVLAVPAGQPLEFAGAFSDPGLLDTHTLELDCDYDGAPLPGTPTIAVQPDYAGTCTWSAAGVYRVGITIVDDDGGAGGRISDPVVVHVPGTGHVTGGGWIDSPAGACQLMPACTGTGGRASFGFTSKYVNRSAAPAGNVTFQLGAELTFKATSQLWLSVAGAVARIGGIGKINGKGQYDFLLTVVDGELYGSADGFRIRLRDRANGVLVYDSRPGTDPYADDASEVSGGSVVIHRAN